METLRLTLYALLLCMIVYTSGRIATELLTQIADWILTKLFGTGGDR